MHKVGADFYFDYSSPWTYLLFHKLAPILVNDPGVEDRFKPTLVGVLFNQVNDSVYRQRESKPNPRKVKYMNKDMQDWAKLYGIKILGPYEAKSEDRPHPFPVNSAKALRGAYFFLKENKTAEFLNYSNKIFASYWSESKDISDMDIIASIANNVIPGCKQSFIHFVESKEAKDLLKSSTKECMDRGSFGVPTVFVEDDMYFGNDRFALIEAKIEKAKL